MAHVQFRTNYDQRDVPIPTKKPPTGTVKRAKTLIRPERGVAPVPLITPPSAIAATPSGTAAPGKPAATSSFSAWVIFSRIITFWAPPFLLSSIGGFKDKATMQAWREKMALCFIVLLLCAVVGFATVGLQKVLCPQVSAISSHVYVRIGSVPGTVGIRGELFNSTSARFPNDVNLISSSGQDITTNFQRTASDFPRCSGVNARIAQDEPCPNTGDCKLGPLFTNSTFQTLNIFRTGKLVGYDWDQVSHSRNYIVINGAVLNMGPYMKMHPNPIPSDTVDAALRTILRAPDSGKDGTRLFHNRNDLGKAVPCLVERYVAGNIDKITPGCFASQLILYAGLVVILGLVLVRFAMACVFNWFLSERLAGAPSSSLLNRSAISPAVLPEGANISIDNRTGTAPWAGPGAKKLLKANSKSTRSFTSSSTLVSEPSPVMSLAKIGAELFAVCLVTCYSEGEVSLRTTLDSISLTNYSDSRKLLFVVADGMITGAGEKRSTPDICVSLLDADPRFGQPMPMSYIAVGSGSKRLNRAMVYAGHYSA
jgi:chitin synthase